MQLLNPERSLDRTATLALEGLRRGRQFRDLVRCRFGGHRLFELPQNGSARYEMALTKWEPIEGAVSACLWARTGEIQRIDAPGHAHA
jgi:hypothetical protein